MLALTAVSVARRRTDSVDPTRTLTMRTLRRLVPLSARYDGNRLVTREHGQRVATPLFAALVMVAASDAVFALDSIPAVFAVTRDTVVVFAANAFSLLGAVSLYFVLDGALARFRSRTTSCRDIPAALSATVHVDAEGSRPLAHADSD